MHRRLGIAISTFSMLLLAGPIAVRATAPPPELVAETEADAVGDVERTTRVSKALQDTVWIADWSFDASCSATGWVTQDLRPAFDGTNFWCISAAYNDSGGAGIIVNKAAVLRAHDLCFAQDGYGNDWDYSIILKYRGGASNGGSQPTLTFKFLSDSELNYDFVTVECDSLGLSETRVDYLLNPRAGPDSYRDQVFSTTGLNNPGIIASPLALIDYTPADPTRTHEVYIRFLSDNAYSDEDGLDRTYLHAGLVVDHIVVGGTLAYSENFEAASGCATTPTGGGITGVNPNITLQNTQSTAGFAPNPVSPAPWARIFRHITDNDKCQENATCAWLNTDPSRPRYFPDMGFAPGGAVVRNWLDDLVVSPWVSLTSTPTATGTVMHWRRFPGNNFHQGKIVQGWRVRGLSRVDNTDTPAPGDSVDCVTPWGHALSFSILSTFNWISSFADLTSHFGPLSTRVQISFRHTDFQLIGGSPPPVTLNTGPGPFNDRVRIGRRVLSGPVINEGIDSRSQSQDAFGAVTNSMQPGEHHSPSTSPTRRFDPVPFDQSADLATRNSSPNVVTGDSIHVSVTDVRVGGNGIASVKLYAAIVSGPHAGKRPPGMAAGPGGFFIVNADTVRSSAGAPLAGNWFVDLPDSYLRGGDEIVYFWGARDHGNGFSSDPYGIPGDASGNPDVSSVAEAEEKTGGLLGMSSLPAMRWDPAYLATVAADPEGDVAPTPQQIASSTQKNCILYYNEFSTRRRSSLLQRTTFMYTLDRLGYRGHYDIYDLQGLGNTNNHLGSRATEAHATGYALLVQDTGRLASLTVPDGNGESEKVNQAQWYRNWLANGLTSEIGTATLWFVGENVVQEKGTNPLFSADMGVALGSVDNGTATLNPDVVGEVAFTFQSGCNANFTLDRFSLQGGCPTARNYDGLSLTTGTGTHKYKTGDTESPFWAVVMNKNTNLKWNTIVSSFNWFDIRDAYCSQNPPGTGCSAPGRAEKDFLARVLACVVPLNCQRGEGPTDLPQESDAPRWAALYQNVPNPFNPTTTIRFDLPRDGHVELQIFDVSGRRVRGLVNGRMKAGRAVPVMWDGRDDAGQRVSSGVYLYRLVAGEFTATRKMIALK